MLQFDGTGGNPSPMALKHLLTVSAGPDKGLSLEIPSTGPCLVLVGRCFEALPSGLSHLEPHRLSLVFSDLTVSARHAVLLRAGTGAPLLAYDMGSRNGSTLRGASLQPCLSFVGDGHTRLGRQLRPPQCAVAGLVSAAAGGHRIAAV